MVYALLKISERFRSLALWTVDVPPRCCAPYCANCGTIIASDEEKHLVKILIIDDHPDVITALTAILQEHQPECEIITSPIAEGLLHARVDQPDVILLHYQPREHADQRDCGTLKADPVTQTIPIILFVDPTTEPAARFAGLAVGGDALMALPVDPAALLAQVRSMARLKQAEDAVRREADEIAVRIQLEDALRESEEKHRILLDESPDPIFSFTIEGKYRYANRAFADGTGKSLDQIIGHTIWEVFPREEAEMRLAALSRVFATGEQKVIEVRVPRDDGDRYYLTTITPIKDRDGHVATAICSSKEITARKQAEEALRESKARLDLALHSAGMGAWHWDVVANKRFFDDQVCRMLGLDPATFTGDAEEFFNTIHADDLPIVHEALAGVLRQDSPYAVEFRAVWPDGSIHHIASLGRMVRDASGAPLRLIGITQDITERKRAEEALRESEERYRLLMELAPDAIYLHRDGHFIYANRSGLHLLGAATPDELLGTRVLDRVHADYHGVVEQLIHEMLAYGHLAQPVEEVLLRLDGSTVEVEVIAAMIHYQCEATMLVMARDITARKQMAAERDLLQHQLAQAQKLESIGRLAGGVAHDFNNMLGVIIGHAELAQMDLPDDAPLKHDLQQILSTAQKSADLTRQLLAFARKQIIRPVEVQLNDAVSGMLKMLQRLIGENIRLVWEPGEALWPVTIDPSQVDQIMANLAVNARDAIAGVGTVTITTANVVYEAAVPAAHIGLTPGNYVRITFTDDGSGIDPSVLPSIFDPFFTTKGFGQGTGLGLATVYGIVQQNQGGIEVSSTPDMGTTFTIYLPRSLHSAQLLPVIQPALQQHPVTETVLLVEDEPSILRIAKKILEELGYTVMAVDSPEKALRLMEGYLGTVHLLLTDMIMPEMNGRELAERVVRMQPGVRCLFMSGYTTDIIGKEDMLDEQMHFLQKPFTIAQLASAVQRAMKNNETESATP